MRPMLLLAFAAGFATPLSAQPETATAGLRTAGAFFAVSVGSLPVTQAWYEQTLGLRVVLRPPAGAGVSVVVLEGGGLMVELIESARSRPAPAVDDPLTRQGLFKVGVIIENYEAFLQRIRDRGIPFAFGPFPGGNGQRANFAVRDPSGTLLQFFAR